jgi:hypothetical protein
MNTTFRCVSQKLMVEWNNSVSVFVEFDTELHIIFITEL